MVTTVYIIRHCEAIGNLYGVFQGSTDFDISSKGEKQLDKLAERCKDIKFDVAYCSPLIRARKTAYAALKYSNPELYIDDGLSEINGGYMENKPWDRLHELFPEEYFSWKNSFGSFKAPGGESVEDVYDRIVQSFKMIVENNNGKTIGVFSHGCAIRILMCFIKNIPLSQIDEIGWTDNTSITCVEIDENQNIIIKYENDYSHIMNDSSTVANRMWWGGQS